MFFVLFLYLMFFYSKQTGYCRAVLVTLVKVRNLCISTIPGHHLLLALPIRLLPSPPPMSPRTLWSSPAYSPGPRAFPLPRPHRTQVPFHATSAPRRTRSRASTVAAGHHAPGPPMEPSPRCLLRRRRAPERQHRFERPPSPHHTVVRTLPVCLRCHPVLLLLLMCFVASVGVCVSWRLWLVAAAASVDADFADSSSLATTSTPRSCLAHVLFPL